MRNRFFKIVALLLFAGVALNSCNSESDVVMSETALNPDKVNQKMGNIWLDRIGIIDGSDYIVTADEGRLKSELTAMLNEKGDPAIVESITIQKRTAENDPNDTAYFLIGQTAIGPANTTSSMGVLLSPSRNGRDLYISPGIGGEGDPDEAGCRGCPTGCFLKYYIIGKDRAPYCDSAGCNDWCTKF